MELFHNDYNEICHPAVLQKMIECAGSQFNGYGEDDCCKQAKWMIRALCKSQSAAVHFLVGGTQTNMTVIASALRPHQAVIGAVSAHINTHETGAVEATGHKILSIPTADGKISAYQIRTLVKSYQEAEGPEHMVQPKMVYISDSTELGTIYTLRELEEISAACKDLGLYLFVDGARLGYALTAADNDVTLPDLARLTDVFYIGGTKVGAMFGEAVVISNPLIAEDFHYFIKQNGGMLAKGWLLGLQFQVLMQDDLYFSISRRANVLADRIRSCLEQLGYPLLVENRTNQIFAVLPDRVLSGLGEKFSFGDRQRVDLDHSSVRFCTSWATTDEAVEALCLELAHLS